MINVIELWQRDFVYRLDIGDEQISSAPDSLDFVIGATRVSLSSTRPGAYNHYSAEDLLSEFESKIELYETPDSRIQRSGTVPFAHPRDRDAQRSFVEFREPDGGGLDIDKVACTLDDGTVVLVSRACTSISTGEDTKSDFEAFAASLRPRSAEMLSARKDGWLDYKVGPLSVTAPPGWTPKPEMNFFKAAEGACDSHRIDVEVADAASQDWAAVPNLVTAYLMPETKLVKTSTTVRRESWGTVEARCWAAVPPPEPDAEYPPDHVQAVASAVISWNSGGACLVMASHSPEYAQYESEPDMLETLRGMVEAVALAISRVPRTPSSETHGL